VRTNAIGGIPETGQVPAWVRNQNPTPARNFDLNRPLRYAEDVNGDGTTDYLYTDSTAQDATTMGLAHETGTTALFYGGTPGETPGQLLRTDLYPDRDLNDDGFDDALHVDGTTVRLFTGLSAGDQDSGTALSVVGSGRGIRGFSDLDGDGFEDALISGARSDVFSVMFGASALGSVPTKTYTAHSTFASSEYACELANLDESGGERTYWFKHVDADGTARHSELVAVRRGTKQVELRKTHRNPAADQITVRYALPPSTEGKATTLRRACAADSNRCVGTTDRTQAGAAGRGWASEWGLFPSTRDR